MSCRDWDSLSVLGGFSLLFGLLKEDVTEAILLESPFVPFGKLRGTYFSYVSYFFSDVIMAKKAKKKNPKKRSVDTK